MSKHEADVYGLWVRPDFDDPDTLDAGVLALHIVATTEKGLTVRAFLVEVDEVFELEPPKLGLRIIKVRGRSVTGERIVCTLTYDVDSTQTLSVESVNDSSVE